MQVVDVRVLVHLFDRVDERAAFQRDTTTYGVDPRVGAHHARRHRQLQFDRVSSHVGIGARLHRLTVDGGTICPGRDPQ